MYASFFLGFTSRSLASLVVGLCVFLLGLALGERVVGSGYVWRAPKILYATRNDDAAQVNYLIHEILGDKTDSTRVIVLSASSTREAFLKRNEVEDRLLLATHHASKFFNMSMSSESFAESLQILEVLDGAIPKGIVAIGVSPAKIFYNTEADLEMAANKERLPYLTPVTESILEESGIYPSKTILPFAFWLQRSWIKRAYEHTLDPAKSKSYEQYAYLGLQRWSPEMFSRNDLLEHNFGPLVRYRENWVLNRKLLSEMARWGRRNAVPIVLIELTLHSSFYEGTRHIADFKSLYRNEILKFAAEYELPYFNLVETSGLQDSDFFNYGHILTGKSDYTDAFVESIARIYNETYSE